MTREEEINNYAYNNCINDDIDDTSYSLIVETAKWADETIIEKACEWLNKTLYIHTEEIEDKHWNEIKTFDLVTSDFDSVSDFIEGFRKAMEE